MADMSKASELVDLLDTGEELTIVCHNNPDPDCLASALALGTVAAESGIDEHRIMYSGSISHQQNRAFVNLLEMDLIPFDAEVVADRPPSSLLALVDHSRPGANNEVSAETHLDIVIDHHPAEEVHATFVDHRVDVGATATILTEYIHELAVTPSSNLATGLLFAIRRETLGFLRGTTVHEFEAARSLHEQVDPELLRRLTMPAISGATIDAIADAIKNRSVRGSVLITHVGRTSERDALPQAADYLATLEGVGTAIVFGLVDNSIELSARSTDARIHIGDVMHEAFEDVGSAGGHRSFAGGEVPLGIVAEYADGDNLIDIVEQVITKRLVDALNLADNQDEATDSDDQS